MELMTQVLVNLFQYSDTGGVFSWALLGVLGAIPGMNGGLG